MRFRILVFSALFVGCSSGSAGTNGDAAQPSIPANGTGGTTGAGGSSAGGTNAGGSSATDSSPLPCDVDAIVEAHCRMCHQSPPLYGAPMPLLVRGDFLRKAASDPSKTVAELAENRIQNDQTPMPPAPNPRLSASEIATMEAWLGGGTPARPAGEACSAPMGGGGASGGGGGTAQGGSSSGGSPSTGGASSGGSSSGGSPAGGSSSGGTTGYGGSPTMSCSPDTMLVPQTGYVSSSGTTDVYICYGFDVPAPAAKRQIVQISPIVDNAKIVHHFLLMEADKSQPAAPTECGGFPISWKLLYAWAPGAGSLTLPPEAGFPVDPGSTIHYVVQVHYSNLQHLDGEVDASGIAMCTTDQLRPNDADIAAFGGMMFSIPPHAQYTLDCSTSIGSSFPSKVHVFQAWPHMHLLGNHLTTQVHHADGTVTPVVDVPFSFSQQLQYPEGFDLVPGDRVETACTWNNSTNASVGFGEATSDEMCFDFFTYYPRASLASWLLPAYYAQCQ